MRPGTAKSVAEYVAKASPDARKALRQMRAAIRKAAPGVKERISYDIPTFDLDGRYLVYIAAFREHVSMYPVTRAINSKHSKQIAKYRHGAATLRFPLDEPLPVALVTKLVKTRVTEHRARATSRTKSAGR